MEPDDIPIGDGLETMACPDCDGSGFDDEDGSPCGNCGGLCYVDAIRAQSAAVEAAPMVKE
jgi:DnaJ-class molecular chaperone